MGSIDLTDELLAAGGGGREKIFVSVRLRPLNAKELERSDPCDWECTSSTTVFCNNSLPERSLYPAVYTFDRVFGCGSSTKQVYEEGIKEVVLSVVRGINSSVFAYGQTSSGKTFTMSGVTEYAVADIYDYIQRHGEREFVLKLSAMEIYNEAVRDLLSLDISPLRLLDDPERGTIVEKLTEETLRDQDHLKELLSLCEAQRQIGETSLNEMSSRSHQILRLTVESTAREFLSGETSNTLSATVNFVDLAGSERASQALSAGTRLKEGCHINRSLLTLGTVVRKLSKGRNGHIPYRDSKLTRILQSSLGENARTAIICTMSPARSHIEQSRNTLLFASCAKEVSTNAKVNLVMSDKALVKHLQRELARLESELRYSGSTCSSHSETIRDKDAQIKKMEREIKELSQQRNLAQSRLEDILRALGDDQASLQWDETTQCSVSHVHDASEDVFSVSEISGIAYENPYGTLKTDNQHESCNSLKQRISLPTHSGSLTSFIAKIPQQKMEEMTETISQNSEEHCKEVQCIEVHASRTNQSEEFNLLLTDETKSFLCQRDEVKLGVSLSQSEGDFHLRAQIEELPEGMGMNCIESCSEESSSLPTMQNAMSSIKLLLTKSRSFKPNLMTDPVTSWYECLGQDNKAPPNSFLKEFCGRPEGVQIGFASSRYDAEKEEVSIEVSHASKRLTFTDVVKAQDIQDIIEENSIGSINSPIDKTDQSGRAHKQLYDDQVTKMREKEDSEVEITLKDVGIDSKPISQLAPSIWEEEFERKQHGIIELWNSCNVSLVHRTCFFLLFKGDPADSFYMEVEERRLSFLRNTFSPGNTSNILAEDGRKFKLASSLRYLQREREMLYRQMKKKLSLDERKNIYTKWGISLDSKQRRLQVVRNIWTGTDMEHVRESASIVAKLIGIPQEGQVLKGMFELNFAMSAIHRRSFIWKPRKYPFM